MNPVGILCYTDLRLVTHSLAERALLLNPEAANGTGLQQSAVNGNTSAQAPSARAASAVVAAPDMELDESTSLSIPPSSRDNSVMPDAGISAKQRSSSPLPDLESEDLTIGEGEEEKDDVVSHVDELADTVEVGSDVDELESSSDERAAKEAAAEKPARGRKRKQSPKMSPKPPVDRKTEIEEELDMNTKKEDLYERDWRRHREVARIRPLGKDRFHTRVC